MKSSYAQLEHRYEHDRADIGVVRSRELLRERYVKARDELDLSWNKRRSRELELENRRRHTEERVASLGMTLKALSAVGLGSSVLALVVVQGFDSQNWRNQLLLWLLPGISMTLRTAALGLDYRRIGATAVELDNADAIRPARRRWLDATLELTPTGSGTFATTLSERAKDLRGIDDMETSRRVGAGRRFAGSGIFSSLTFETDKWPFGVELVRWMCASVMALSGVMLAGNVLIDFEQGIYIDGAAFSAAALIRHLVTTMAVKVRAFDLTRTFTARNYFAFVQERDKALREMADELIEPVVDIRSDVTV